MSDRVSSKSSPATNTQALEPLSPEAITKKYLNQQGSDWSKPTRRHHGVGLHVFVRWTEDACINSMDQINEQRLIDFKIWWDNGVGYSALDFDRNYPILRPFFEFCREQDLLESDISLPPTSVTQDHTGRLTREDQPDGTATQLGGSPNGKQDSTPEFESLNDRQQTVYHSVLERFETYLREKGKDPRKALGYAEDSIKPRVSRLHLAFRWIWEHEEVTTEFTTTHADQVVEALETDAFRQRDGERYSEASKRKVVDTLRNWFEFQGTEWDPEHRFTGTDATGNADPFTRAELRAIWQASLEYKTVPSYKNVTPVERNRWKAYIAQELGKPKAEVSPADWEAINRNWKIPSLIRTTRAAGWRPAMVGRLSVEWYDETTKTIHIPQGEAVKNDTAWSQELDGESAMTLERWFVQRANLERYDGRDEIWLNRQGNPYQSGSLNRLLGNLLEQAGIEQRGRTLVWYSFRHSIGTHVYDEFRDLRSSLRYSA